MVQDIKATWNFKFNHYSFCIRRLDKGVGKRNGEGVAHSLHTRDLRDEDSELETSSVYLLAPLKFQTRTLASKLVSVASREAGYLRSDQRIRKATGQVFCPGMFPLAISL